LASLEATKWLSHISSLIKTALVVVKAVEQERQHVVVHCSDGWDRTPQVVALAELLLDPFYRTIKVRFTSLMADLHSNTTVIVQCFRKYSSFYIQERIAVAYLDIFHVFAAL
jgi:protein tyrosine phosphatase